MVSNNNNNFSSGGNAGAVVDPSQNPASHFFVHPSDGPGTVTVTPVLDGSNYHIWARSMRRALGSKNKYRFVDGSIEPLLPLWTQAILLGKDAIYLYILGL